MHPARCPWGPRPYARSALIEARYEQLIDAEVVADYGRPVRREVPDDVRTVRLHVLDPRADVVASRRGPMAPWLAQGPTPDERRDVSHVTGGHGRSIRATASGGLAGVATGFLTRWEAHLAWARQFVVYIVANVARTLHVRVTNDLQRRVSEHGAYRAPGFTSMDHPIALAYDEGAPDIRDMIARGKRIKGWLRAKRVALIESVNLNWRDLGGDLGG